MNLIRRIGIATSIALAAASGTAHAQRFVLSDAFSTWDYDLGSTTPLSLANPPALGSMFAISGVESVGTLTYALSSFPSTSDVYVSRSGGPWSILPGVAGISDEGDLAHNPAEICNLYALENTTGCPSLRRIWKVDPYGGGTVLHNQFVANDPSGIAFDRTGRCFILDTMFHASCGIAGNGGATPRLLELVLTGGGAVVVPTVWPTSAVSSNTVGMDFNPFTNELYLIEGNGQISFLPDPASWPPPGTTMTWTPFAAVPPNFWTGLAFVKCVADVDDGSGTGQPDGGVTIEDLLFYLGIFISGDFRADIDDGFSLGQCDGGLNIDDLLFYLLRYNDGC